MKRRNLFLSIIILLTVCIVLCACVVKDDSSTVTLSTPVLTINSEGVASWTSVENAVKYAYIIDGGEQIETDKLSVQLSDGQSIQVKSIGNGEKYLDSEYSDAKVYTAPAVEPTKLATPEVNIDENGLATWNTIEHASGYVYVINKGAEQTVEGLSVQLSDGESIQVKAIGDGTLYIDSDMCEAVKYTAPVVEPTKLATPKVSIDTNGVATWNVIEHASGYSVWVNDVEYSYTSEQTTISFDESYEIKVKAVGDGKLYLDSDYSESQFYTAPEPIKLATPTVSVDENGLATWTAIENAVTYQIILCGEDMGTDNILEMTLTDGESIQVKAIGDGVLYLDSELSEVVTYTAPIIEPIKLATPEVSVDENGLATWTAIENAVTYQIILCGEDMGTDNILEMTLTDGESIQVKAIGDGVLYLDSELSEVVIYTAPIIEPIKLATPKISVDENGLATWTAIENAVTYQIILCGEDMGTDNILEMTLTDGESIQVKAIGDGVLYLDSDLSEVVTYTAPKNCDNGVHTVVIDEGYEATCTETGLTEGSHCSVCGVTIMAQEVIPALGHKIENHVGQEATCTEIGWEAYEACTRCEYTTYVEIPLKDHTIVIDSAVSPTCSKTGLTEGSHCSVCSAIIKAQEEIPMLAHTEETIKGKDASCTEKGLTDGVICSVCNTVLTEQKEIPAKGHTEVSIKGKEATCTEDGLSDGVKCSVCSIELTKQEAIPAKGHTEEIIVGKPATCTETGLSDGVRCSVCTVVLTEQKEISALGHKIENHEGKEATCSEKGWQAYESCTRCTYTTYVEIPLRNHTVVIDSAVSPTCTKTGLTEGSHCSVCSAVIKAQETVSMVPHTEETINGKPATCTETGLTDGVRCSVCNTVLTEQKEIPAKGHNYTWTVTEAPTVNSYGKEQGVCANDSTHTTERNAALTVAEAIALIESGSTELNDRYVLATYAGSYTNGYYISDEGSTVTFTVYRPTLGEYTYDTMHIGDAILVQGTLADYYGTPEYNSGSVIVGYAHKSSCYLDYASTVVNDESGSYKPLSEYNKETALILNTTAIEVYGGSVSVAWSIKETDSTASLNGNEIVLPETESAIITLVATLTYGETSTTVEFGNINVLAINSHVHVYNPANQTCEELVDGVVCGQINPEYLVYEIKAEQKNLIFNSSTNDKSVSGYTSTFNTTNDGMTWTLTNFNNNNNGWAYVRAGRKGNASVATMTSNLASAVSKIVMTVDSVTADLINSIKLYVSDTADFTNVIETVAIGTIATGDLEFAITKPQANLYYKIEIDCASGTKNGFIQISGLTVTAGEDAIHNADPNGVEITNATCSATGSVDFICQDCGEIHSNVIPMLPEHTYGELIAQTNATCCANGELAHYHCSVCGSNFDENKVVMTDITIPATGEHNWVKSTESIEPTCIDDGLYEYTCSTEGCTATKDEIVPATGHLDEDNNGVCDKCNTSIGELYSVTVVYSLSDIDESLITLAWTPDTIVLESIPNGTEIELTVTSDVYNIIGIEIDSPDAIVDGNYAIITVNQNINVTIMVEKKTTALGTPVVTVDSTGMASWEAVANANEYEVYVNDALKATQTATSYQLNDGETITVKAKAYETTTAIYTESALSEAVTYTKSTEPTTLATFTFGDNGAATHSDGSSASAYTEESNGYTLTLSSMSSVSSKARIMDGNSALKLGTGSKAGSFTFTVADDVKKVVIRVTGYKANAAKIDVNGTTYTTAKNAGSATNYTPEYLEIEVDTSVEKTITFKTLSGGYRVMVDSITYLG